LSVGERVAAPEVVAERLERFHVIPALDEHDPARDFVRFRANLLFARFHAARRFIGNEQVTSGDARRSGKRRLYVNPNYTDYIDGLTKAESDGLLAFLYEHIKSPEFQMRYTWSVGDIAFWDNLAVQHYAVADYTTRRRMQRVTLLGSRPIGVGEARVSEAA